MQTRPSMFIPGSSSTRMDSVVTFTHSVYDQSISTLGEEGMKGAHEIRRRRRRRCGEGLT